MFFSLMQKLLITVDNVLDEDEDVAFNKKLLSTVKKYVKFSCIVKKTSKNHIQQQNTTK